MADVKWTEFPSGTAIGTDLIPFVSDPGGTPINKTTTLDVLATTVFFTKPTHNATRGSTTMGSLSTPWTDTVVVASGQAVQYHIELSWSCTTQPTIYLALAVDGTIVNRQRGPSAGANNNQTPSSLAGMVTGLSAASHTFEVYIGTNGGETVTVSSTVDTSTAVSLTADGVSSMSLWLVRAA